MRIQPKKIVFVLAVAIVFAVLLSWSLPFVFFSATEKNTSQMAQHQKVVFPSVFIIRW